MPVYRRTFVRSLLPLGNLGRRHSCNLHWGPIPVTRARSASTASAVRKTRKAAAVCSIRARHLVN